MTKIHNFSLRLVLFFALLFPVTACTKAETEIPVETLTAAEEVVETQIQNESIPTANAEQPAEISGELANGFISGEIKLSQPPTPSMVIYAVDTFSGLWFSQETLQSDAEVSFEIEVVPGSYILYAFSHEGKYAAYTRDNYNLNSISVSAGQKITHINVTSPIITTCAGPTFGLPASPDGLFAEIPGPTAFCAEPESKPNTIDVYPETSPFDFAIMQSIDLSAVPPMLPPVFPVEEGLPEITASLLTNTLGEYEIILEYGLDCNGANACHYGAISGLNADSDTPVGSSNFVCEARQMETISLEMNITGYFIDYQCGISCGDAKLFWLYDGVQYMLALKAGSKEAISQLANAAILNSIH
ncbi:MAG: hypothetical protein JEZ06_17645 [Anaerolineaceae bacterium]|nr:hypothetical protein [Anaerolineaceae bacterium]